METIAIHIPATPELTKLVEALLALPGVKVSLPGGAGDPREFLTIRQAAEEAKMSYSAFRRAVVDRNRVKHSRPNGPKGDIRIRRADLVTFLESSKTVRPGRKASGVRII